MATAAGLEISLVCLMEGGAASEWESAGATRTRLMRRAELAAAGGVLGIRHWEVLDFPDGSYRLWISTSSPDLGGANTEYLAEIALTLAPMVE